MSNGVLDNSRGAIFDIRKKNLRVRGTDQPRPPGGRRQVKSRTSVGLEISVVTAERDCFSRQELFGQES